LSGDSAKQQGIFTNQELIPKDPATAYALDSYDIWHFRSLVLADPETRQRLHDEPALILPALDLYAMLYKAHPTTNAGVTSPLCQEWVRQLEDSESIQEIRRTTILHEWRTASLIFPMLRHLQELLDTARSRVAESDGSLGQLKRFDTLLILSDLMEREEISDDEYNDLVSELPEPESTRQIDEALEETAQALDEKWADLQKAARAMEHLMHSLSPHGDRTASSKSMPIEQVLWLGRILAQNPALYSIIEMAGRMTQVMREKPTSRKRPGTGNEVHAITLGGDLERILPTELLGLKHPALRRALLARLVQRRALQYEVRGPEKLGRGPVVFVVDASGSMQGPRMLFAKALMMAMGFLCWEQRRPFIVLTFGARGSLTEHRIEVGAPFYRRMKNCLEQVFFGGTDFNGPFERIRDIVTEKPWGNADAIFITDGDGQLDPETIARFEEVKTKCDLQVLGVLLGQGAGIEALCDTCFAIEPTTLSEGLERNILHCAPILKGLQIRI
tara:strand:- start:389 stop:1897 length:1509 start_codon:yes stop_codon:yes gene_type:complete